jgi:hypothetical protein
MTPLVIVMPQELLQDPQEGLGAARSVDRVTLIIDGLDKTLDLSARRRRVRSDQMTLDAETAAGLLKPGLPVAVKGEAHGKDQIVVGHDRFDSVRQLCQHLFQEIAGHPTAAIRGIPVSRLNACNDRPCSWNFINKTRSPTPYATPRIGRLLAAQLTGCHQCPEIVHHRLKWLARELARELDQSAFGN